jgi:DNA-directed RNA polymerase specialized sigma24 family protein
MARPHRKKPPLSPEQVEKNAEILESIGQGTRLIRESQENILNLSKARTEAVLYARENGVSYQSLAEAMGTSEQTVYKIVKPYLKKKEQSNDL